MSDARWDPLRAELDRLAGDARHGLRRVQTVTALRSELRGQAWKPALLLLLALSASLFGRAFEATWLQWGGGMLLALALVPYLFLAGSRALALGRAAVARQRALGEWDRQCGLSDRLTAADEFLGTSTRSGFMEAAVEDADAQMERVRAAELRFSHTPGTARGFVGPAFVATGLFLACLWAGGWSPASADPGDGIVVELPPATVAQDTVPEGEPPVREPEPAPAGVEGQQRPPDEEASSETHASDAVDEEVNKETQGMTGSGRSSAAEASTGAGSAQGTPSKQGQISKPGERQTNAKKKPSKPKAPPKSDDKAKKNDEQESGSTAGRGSSRGSNRNPAASDWASKDHVNTPDDEDLDDEDDVEDEEEEQEARGGMQPSLRDRKPPVSRDLSIGFGNQPNPDARGRGGPSQPKKSRGTASLVLGVPIPDRIKGQPNPGKTKITQERVQPRAEPASAAAAEARPAREAPSSALRRQELTPWMQALVRDWFLRQRTRTPNDS